MDKGIVTSNSNKRKNKKFLKKRKKNQLSKHEKIRVLQFDTN